MNDLDDILVPITTLQYKRVHNYGIHKYRLSNICYTQSTIQYCSSSISIMEKCNSCDNEAGIKVFNDIYVPIINKTCVSVELFSDGYCYTCSPSLNADQLDIIKKCRVSNFSLCNQHLLTSDVSCSVYSLSHDFVETSRGRLVHIGLSVIPCTSMFVPTWLSDDTLREFLHIWNSVKLPIAIKHSIYTIRNNHGPPGIFKLR